MKMNVRCHWKRQTCWKKEGFPLKNGKINMKCFEKRTTKTIKTFISNILKYFVTFCLVLFEKLLMCYGLVIKTTALRSCIPLVWLPVKTSLEDWLVTLDSITLVCWVIQISLGFSISKWPNVVVSWITDKDSNEYKS